jgi:DNA primase
MPTSEAWARKGNSKLFTHRQSNTFRRELLPPPHVFYSRELQKFRVRGSRATALCPFHRDHCPSLSVDLTRGLFHCFTCGAGGDIVSFVRLRDDVDFPTACKSLGAWDDRAAVDVRAHREREIKRELARKAEEHLADVLLKLRLHYVRELERHRNRARRGRGYDPHQDRRAAAAHAIVSFAPAKERFKFAAGDRVGRDAMIDEALLRGYVDTGDGHIMDVTL